MADKPAAIKIRRALLSVRNAWWVLLITASYMIIASSFLGTSCIFASFTGIPCPGCGITRAFIDLLSGDIVSSFFYYPLLIPSVVFFCVYLCIALPREQKPRALERALIVYAVIFIGVYATRMVLYFPHTEPMVINDLAVLMRIIALFA